MNSKIESDPALLDSTPRHNGLYRPEFEFDSCGVGLVASISGVPKHEILRTAIEAVVGLSHRGAVSADGKTGDGAGILTQIPVKLVQRELAAKGINSCGPQ